ncbi:MAG: DUF2585 family protein [Dehalococcoidia bacterium]|nr:DUF2585 family protein [Dehalococcoidia bacterium]
MDLSPRGMSMRTAAILVAAMIAAGAGALWLMGQPLSCRCGEIAVWSCDIWSSQNSQQVADPYSFTHITHGVLFFWALYPLRRRLALSWRLVAAMAIEVSWGVAENTPMVTNRYREATISLDYFGDSVLNSSFDALFCVAGFALASRLPWRIAALGVVASAVALALTIRDSLLLNIIMLLVPMTAIREWQAAGYARG